MVIFMSGGLVKRKEADVCLSVGVFGPIILMVKTTPVYKVKSMGDTSLKGQQLLCFAPLRCKNAGCSSLLVNL
ncbi:hypothetical protein [Cesiribacter andamanensis]|uniref:hypothetical protein n=1 Tax=Cesiribacter andamanensis TaxID=649507 RepID=UPI0012696BFD|nr:hypothetical protein [Cesiribacter andamanensis]